MHGRQETLLGNVTKDSDSGTWYYRVRTIRIQIRFIGEISFFFQAATVVFTSYAYRTNIRSRDCLTIYNQERHPDTTSQRTTQANKKKRLPE